jgi:hypothetical protein
MILGILGRRRSLVPLIVALLVVGVSPGRGLPGASPSIRLEQDVVTFWPMLEEDSVDVSFAFSNRGAGPLVIYDAVTSCGCTTADYPQRPLKPGERGIIRTTFQSRGHAGDVDLTLLVKSNDPLQPEKMLHIRGRVTRQWQVKPDRLVLTYLSSGPAYEKALQVINYMDVPLRIREVSSGADFIHLLSAPKEVPPGGEKTIPCEVQVDGLEPGKVRQSSIRIIVANARMKLVEVPVLVTLK